MYGKAVQLAVKGGGNLVSYLKNAPNAIKNKMSSIFNSAKKASASSTAAKAGTAVTVLPFVIDNSTDQNITNLVETAETKSCSVGEVMKDVFTCIPNPSKAQINEYNEVMTFLNNMDAVRSSVLNDELAKQHQMLEDIESINYDDDDIAVAGAVAYEAKDRDSFARDLIIEDSYKLIRQRFPVRFINAWLQIFPLLQQPDGMLIFDQLEERYARTRGY
jgi:hypothetical protein